MDTHQASGPGIDRVYLLLASMESLSRRDETPEPLTCSAVILRPKTRYPSPSRYFPSPLRCHGRHARLCQPAQARRPESYQMHRHLHRGDAVDVSVWSDDLPA